MNFDLWRVVFRFLGIDENVSFKFPPDKLDMTHFEETLSRHLTTKRACTSCNGKETLCVLQVTPRKAFCIMVSGDSVSHWKQIIEHEFYLINYSSEFYFFLLLLLRQPRVPQQSIVMAGAL